MYPVVQGPKLLLSSDWQAEEREETWRVTQDVCLNACGNALITTIPTSLTDIHSHDLAPPREAGKCIWERKKEEKMGLEST